MPTSLSELVDNTSAKQECKTCMERKNIKSECKFNDLKCDKFEYKCRECREIRYDLINGLIKKFPSICQFCNVI